MGSHRLIHNIKVKGAAPLRVYLATMRRKENVIRIAALCAVMCMLSSCVFVANKKEDTKASTTAAADTTTAGEHSAGIYSFICRDEYGDPIEGVTLKICSGSLCTLLMTDGQGKAEYPVSDGDCEISVMSYPEEYKLVNDKSVTTSAEQKQYYFDFASKENDVIQSGSGASPVEQAQTVSEASSAEPPETVSDTTAAPAAEPQWNTFDFEIYDANGKKMRLSDLAGKPVVINLWAKWCGYCIDELPSFSRLYEQYGSKVQFVMLNCDGRGYESEVTSLLKKEGWSFPLYYDYDENSMEYLGGAIPVTVAINSKGELVSKRGGSMSYQKLEKTVRSIMD